MLDVGNLQKYWYREVKLCDCNDILPSDKRLDEDNNNDRLKVDNLGSNHRYRMEKCISDENIALDLHGSESNSFMPTISFDTVPIQGISPDDQDSEYYYGLDEYHELEGCKYSLDDYYNNEDLSHNLQYGGTLKRHNGIARSISPLRFRSSNLRYMGGSFAKYDMLPDGSRVRIDYPSKPAILSESFVINRTHKDWRKKWKERKGQIELRRLDEPSKWYLYPSVLFPETKVDLSDLPIINDKGVAYNATQRAKMKRIARVVRTPVGFPVSPRTLLCHISGRRHTWVALDWTLLELLRDTDHIIVVANLPRADGGSGRKEWSTRSSSESRSRSRSRSVKRSAGVNSSFVSQGTESMVKNKNEEWSGGYTVGGIETVLERLIKYITFVIPSTRAIKITVEIIIGKTKEVLVEALNLHSPDLLVVSSTQYNESDGLINHKSKTLTSVLAIHYPLPVFIVPAKRLLNLQTLLQSISAERHESKLLKTEKDSMTLPIMTRPRLGSARTAPNAIPISIFHSDTEELKCTSGVSSIDSGHSESAIKLFNAEFDNSYNKVSRLRQNYRKRVRDKLLSIEHDDTLSVKIKQFSKIDAIISSSIEFNNELENCDSPSVLELQKIITGGKKYKSFKKKSMLDVLDLPNVKKKNFTGNQTVSQDGISTPRKSAIKFEGNVKGNDGSSVLQQNHESLMLDMAPLHEVQSLSQSNLKNNGFNNPLRKVRSASNNSASNRTKSNDFISLGGERKRGFLLNALFGTSGSGSTSGISSPNDSRRGSFSSNELTSMPSSGRRKKRWGFFR